MLRLVILMLGCMATPALAIDGVSIEYGRGNMVEMSRVGAIWKWDRSWMNEGQYQVTAFWEASLGRWRGYKPDDNNQSITEIGITPVFRLSKKNISGEVPYMEGGFIGLHLISPTFIYTNRKFGSSFQFGNHVGFGVRFGEHRQFDLGYRFQHLSNGDIKKPNQGINFSQAHFVYHY
jgi:lipid A 3-O-deacylase